MTDDLSEDYEASADGEPEESYLMPGANEVSPDVLMRDFSGKKVLILVVAAIVVHVVLIFGSSFGFIRSKLFGTDTSELSKEERVKIALSEATSELGVIVERHNLEMDDLIDKFAGAGSRASRIKAGKDAEIATSTKKDQPAVPKESEKTEPKRKLSELEQKLPKAKPGPELPTGAGADMTGI